MPAASFAANTSDWPRSGLWTMPMETDGPAGVVAVSGMTGWVGLLDSLGFGLAAWYPCAGHG